LDLWVRRIQGQLQGQTGAFERTTTKTSV